MTLVSSHVEQTRLTKVRSPQPYYIQRLIIFNTEQHFSFDRHKAITSGQNNPMLPIANTNARFRQSLLGGHTQCKVGLIFPAQVAKHTQFQLSSLANHSLGFINHITIIVQDSQAAMIWCSS